ncbi:hypothetical protein PGT21_031243 [Puccinia graminis f. sp. tritici]|uniref:Integrase catalytic domain-containing protein n=1 Tax=Puccinia graminis f. sp. tritici TaxID=56615 RepID=A0A5B0MU06_PUCGR|nr:hypothetical protein PGT21_009249 [Puccinia graminis f. sp. tritici]KAA1106221.1 hypothetical protein PGT21_031243 [Puccinia graminis f. sp. tritici]KAA1109269.1 hypothetical protein PGTUg99_024895 [Puccinia graminis f. sp. tritici]KAA1131453.1 hypothetical protein PGTUg99_016185 [Puccinia graminis f. sp. tritici]
MSTFGDEFQPIIEELIELGNSNHQILNHLKESYSIFISERTLSRRKAEWGLSHHAIQQTSQLEEDIRRYFHQGLTNAQIHHTLSSKHGYVHSQRTLERKIQHMELQRRKEDLEIDDDEGMDVVIECVKKIHETPEGHNVGYRRLKQLLQTRYGINIHLSTAAAINRALDPEGVDRRSKRVLKRRVFNVAGPNFIWSADGHDKLKKFGITLYGFIDAWSRKVLAIFVHTTNNNPRHIGYYYLQLVKREGGIPRLTTTDRGTETIEMAGHQINLMRQFGIDYDLDPDQSHRFTKSTHNQKIECLWSQLMKQYNGELISQLYEADEKGYYDPEDPVDHLLFIYLWVPLLQDSLNEWINNYNSYKRRRDRKSMLPSGCSANMCYENPEDHDSEQGLIPIDISVALELENEHYPDAKDLTSTCPEWFSEIVNLLKLEMELNCPETDTQNVWSVLSLLRSAIQLYDSAWLDDITNDPEETIAARAYLLYDIDSTT